MDVLVVALLRVTAPDRRADGLDDHDLATLLTAIARPPRVRFLTRRPTHRTRRSTGQSAKPPTRGSRPRAGTARHRGKRRHRLRPGRRRRAPRRRDAPRPLRRVGRPRGERDRQACGRLGDAVDAGAVRVTTDLGRARRRHLPRRGRRRGARPQGRASCGRSPASPARTRSSPRRPRRSRSAAWPRRAAVADRFVGLHVFNPVPRMELVELAFPDGATDDVARAHDRALRGARQAAVVVPDIPGLRRQPPALPVPLLGRRPARAVRHGRRRDVDACMTLGAGHPMGPLALLDFVGLDVSAAIGEAIGADGARSALRRWSREGALGSKTGRGFYDYEQASRSRGDEPRRASRVLRHRAYSTNVERVALASATRAWRSSGSTSTRPTARRGPALSGQDLVPVMSPTTARSWPTRWRSSRWLEARRTRIRRCGPRGPGRPGAGPDSPSSGSTRSGRLAPNAIDGELGVRAARRAADRGAERADARVAAPFDGAARRAATYLLGDALRRADVLRAPVPEVRRRAAGGRRPRPLPRRPRRAPAEPDPGPTRACAPGSRASTRCPRA